MLPSQALVQEFPEAIRNRGNAHIAAVEITDGSAIHVAARVGGPEDCRVSITRVDGRGEDDEVRFDVSCTCTRFIDAIEACQHLWATFRAAEDQGHLLGSNDRGLTDDNTYLDFIDPPGAPGSTGIAATEQAPDLDITLPQTGPPQEWPVSADEDDAEPEPIAPPNPFLDAVEHRMVAPDRPDPPDLPYTDAPLLYVLDQQASTEQQTTVLTVMHQRRIKGGGYSKPKPIDLSVDDVAFAPGSDRRWLALLMGAPRRMAPTGGHDNAAYAERRPATFVLPPALAFELLPHVARTARAWLRPDHHTPDLVPLAWDDGPAWRFRLLASETDTGFQLNGELYRDGVRVRPTEPFFLMGDGLIAIRRTLARFEAGGEMAFLPGLRQAGAVEIPAADGPTLAYLLTRSGVSPEDLPGALRTTEVRVTPVPRLSLERSGNQSAFATTLSFDYDRTIVVHGADTPTVFDNRLRRVVHRAPVSENDAFERLGSFGFRTARNGDTDVLQIPAPAVTGVAHALLSEGWFVEAEGARYHLPNTVRLSVSSGIDWFDLAATVSFADDAFTLTSVLAAMKAGVRTVRLGDGSVGVLPEEWLRQYAAIMATGTVDGERIRFSRAQGALVDALLAERESHAEIEVDEAFERVRRELAAFTHIEPIDAVESFSGTLRPYQQEGLGWFAFLRRFGFGGCLADDMGLGKTIMVLALLDSRRTAPDNTDVDRRPSLVVVPRSLVGNWKNEAERFTSGLRVLDCSQANRTTDFSAFDAHDVVIATYGTLRRDIAELSGIEFDYVVLDEAQTIKNAMTAGARAARLLRGRHRLALSGTPIENHLGELWSLFEFLNPGMLGRSRVFQRVTAGPDDETTSLISRGLRPFILRRTKEQVASDLPPRTEQTIMCELSPREREIYDGLRRHYRGTLLDRVGREGLAKSRMHVLEALLRLRQAACHTALVDARRHADGSAKFDVLIPRLQEVIAEGHKAIVFSQFTTLLGLLRTELDGAGMKYEYLDGKTRNREAHVERFQTDPEVPLFLISLKAGGLGLNLTAAGYVFLLDPWWNPAVEAQAIDRAHRIGQTREVFAYRLIARDTVEEKVLALQQSKRELADAVLSADAVGLRHLERDDLELLLS